MSRCIPSIDGARARCTVSRAFEALEAWRAAERRLEAVTDPDKRAGLEAEIVELHETYQAAVEEAGGSDVRASGHDEVPSLA